MKLIVGVRFRGMGKAYYFDPLDFDIKKGDLVIVETARGIECGEVVLGPKEINEEELSHPLKNVVRPANSEDAEKLKNNRKKEKDAFKTCNLKVEQHKLDMNLVDVEYAFDDSKIVFYFTAEGRVDFRDLVKDLAGVFRTRIELRQIGVRDESKMLGGLGICGRPFCCSQFLFDFQPVSIKMAKEQGMSLNPVKISGACGRLMCCLKYEQDVYDELLRITPRQGSLVETPEGNGTVLDVNLLAGTLKVRMANSPESSPKSFKREELRVLRDKTRHSGGQNPKQNEKQDLPQNGVNAETPSADGDAAPAKKSKRGSRRSKRGPKKTIEK